MPYTCAFAFSKVESKHEEKFSMLTNLTNTKQTAAWQPCIGLPGAARSVYGLNSSFLITNRGGQSMHRQTPESLGFTDGRQVLI
jgi:hypothetical protein